MHRNVSRHTVLNQLLSKKIQRDIALSRVAALYQLLPGKSVPINFGALPPEVEVDLQSLTTCRTSSLKNAFLKKFKGFSGGSPREEAKASFLKYEEHCRASNQRIRSLREGVKDPYLQAIMFIAQRKIANVLGDFDLKELLDVSRWGPGSTSSCKGPLVTSAAKFTSRPDVTKEFLSRARLLMPLLPSWSAVLTDTDYGTIVNPIMPLVKGNRVAFVPKTAKTHRVIATEPHVNVFFQNGLGRMIRSRLRRKAAVNLDDQTLNQRLAQLGSRTNDLATIDLEGASDTICRELVRDLVPEDWFSWLDATRSHFGYLDGVEIHYQKFSSMGNGATFDLESLIFWALSSAVVAHEGYNPFWVNVFGDDIVVPSGCYAKVVEVLTAVGFLVNSKKSFSSGPFRESCGKDWYLGSNCRPVYIKDVPDTAHHWLRIANQIRLLAHNWGGGLFCDASLLPAYSYAVSRIPERLRRYCVPKELGDAGLISNFDEAVPTRDRHGWDGYWVKGLGSRPITRLSNHRSLITSAVSSISHDVEKQPLRDRVFYREDAFFVASWHDLGPWA